MKSSKSRVDDFLSKKKVPGILEYLETKIYDKDKNKDKILSNTLEYIEQEHLPDEWMKS